MSRNTERLIGKIIGNRYQLQESLAKGGMGSILLGTQINLNRRVAIKVVHQAVHDETLAARFRREAEALAAVVHPSIVQIYDFLEEEDAQFLIMEFVQGRNLKEYIEDPGGAGLSVKDALSMITPVCSALVEIHNGGLLHRDIKPANIIRYMRADKRAGVKLVDFGIARRTDDLGLTSDGYVVGTPHYLSPEVLLGKKHSPAADIYALGITFCELATGIRPFDGEDLHEIIKNRTESEFSLPRVLKGTPAGTLIEHMLQRDESARPSAAQTLSGLEAIQDLLQNPQNRPVQGLGRMAGKTADGPGKRAGDGAGDGAAEQPTACLRSNPVRPRQSPSDASVSPTMLQTPSKHSKQERKTSGPGGIGGGPLALGLAGLIGAVVSAAVVLLVLWGWKGTSGQAGPEKAGASIEQGVTGKTARADREGHGEKDGVGQGVGNGRMVKVRDKDKIRDRRGAAYAETAEMGKRGKKSEKVERIERVEKTDGDKLSDPDEELPTVEELVKRCTSILEGRKLYDQARSAQQEGRVEFAKRAYHAIIQSKGAARTQRMYAAHRLTNIYIRENACAGAREVWKTYLILSGKNQKFPGCP